MYIPTDNQLVDIFTKTLDEQNIISLIGELGMISISWGFFKYKFMYLFLIFYCISSTLCFVFINSKTCLKISSFKKNTKNKSFIKKNSKGVYIAWLYYMMIYKSFLLILKNKVQDHASFFFNVLSATFLYEDLIIKLGCMNDIRWPLIFTSVAAAFSFMLMFGELDTEHLWKEV